MQKRTLFPGYTDTRASAHHCSGNGVAFPAAIAHPSPGDARGVVQLRIKARNAADLLTEQYALQHDALHNPGRYAGNHVTVGFEHEFAGMADEGLHGVSHLQIAESANKMPYTNLPFSLETDAGNELELVDPPFLLETTEPGKPVPHPVDVDIAARMMELRLYDIVNRFPTIYELAKRLGADPGIHFIVSEVRLGPEHLSHNTKGDFNAKNNPVAPLDLLGIRLRPSEKHTRIATQINFATDAATYSHMQEINKTQPESPFLATGEEMAGFITKNIPVDTAPRKMFITQLHRVLAEQIVLPLMQEVRDMQKQEYEGGTRIRNSPKKGIFIKGAWSSSAIKDKNKIWIKDSLMSIGAGILTPKEWDHLVADLANARQAAERLTGTEGDTDSIALFNLARNNMMAVLEEIIVQIRNHQTTAGTIYAPQKSTPFLGHDPKWLGVRQDTYLPPDKVQMPGIWDDRRLHVAETRSQGLSTLVKLQNNNEQIATDKEANKDYNVLKHSYFHKKADSPTGKAAFYDPLFDTYSDIGGETFSAKDTKNPIDRTARMIYNAELKMHYDPEMAMYYDPDKKAYYDQGLRMYYDGRTKSYYNDEGKITLNENNGSETFGMYEDVQRKIYYNPARKAWYNPETREYRDVRTAVFTNPSKDIAFDPKSKARAGMEDPSQHLPEKTLAVKAEGAMLIHDTGHYNRQIHLPKRTLLQIKAHPKSVSLLKYYYVRVASGGHTNLEGEILKTQVGDAYQF